MVVEELPGVVAETDKESFRRRVVELRGLLDKLSARLDAGTEKKAA